VHFALSEITLALGDGQLDHRVAGKMLYAIQQLASLLKFRAQLAAAQPETAVPQVCAPLSGANLGSVATVTEYPNFEKDYELNPGDDIDAEIAHTLRKAEEENALRHVNDMPEPPPGMRIGSAQYKVYRDECYRVLNMQLNHLKHDLRDYYAEKNKHVKEEIEQMKKDVASATPAPQQSNRTA